MKRSPVYVKYANEEIYLLSSSFIFLYFFDLLIKLVCKNNILRLHDTKSSCKVDKFCAEIFVPSCLKAKERDVLKQTPAFFFSMYVFWEETKKNHSVDFLRRLCWSSSPTSLATSAIKTMSQKQIPSKIAIKKLKGTKTKIFMVSEIFLGWFWLSAIWMIMKIENVE